jgi:hypothetical protein
MPIAVLVTTTNTLQIAARAGAINKHIPTTKVVNAVLSFLRKCLIRQRQHQ